MTPEQQTAFLIAAIIGGLIAGGVCGLIPLGLGFWKRRHAFGIAALVVCMLAGAGGGVVVAGPAALLFAAVVLILGCPLEAAPTAADPRGEWESRAAIQSTASPRNSFSIADVSTVRLVAVGTIVGGLCLAIGIIIGQRWGADQRRNPRISGVAVNHDDGDSATKAAQVRTSGAFPIPTHVARSANSKTFKAGEFDASELSISPQPTKGPSDFRAPMVYSANGESLYAVDGNYMLHKIRTADLTEEAVLALGAVCDNLALSREGLVVPLTKADVIWIVDPGTLSVVRKIAAERISLVAASPSSALGVAVRHDSDARHALVHVIDLAKGRVVDKSTQDDWHDIQMSRDGHYLFTAGPSVARYRIERETLVFEEKLSEDQLHSGAQGQLALSSDDKWLAVPGSWAPLPNGANNFGAEGLAIYDAAHFDSPAAVLDSGALDRAVGFDPKRGTIYTATLNSLMTYSPQRAMVAKTSLDDAFVMRMIVDPRGERFAIWGTLKVTYYDAVPGRIPRATGNSR